MLLQISLGWSAAPRRSEITIRRRASERANRQYSCGFGRTVPQFTFSLFKRFVNLISLVSTGFFLFLPVFPGLSTKKRQISLIFALRTRHSESSKAWKRDQHPDGFRSRNCCVLMVCEGRSCDGCLPWIALAPLQKNRPGCPRSLPGEQSRTALGEGEVTVPGRASSRLPQRKPVSATAAWRFRRCTVRAARRWAGAGDRREPLL